MTDAELFIDYAMRFIGVPYKWGGENPISGMDCSGLVSECLNSFGIIPGRHTAQSIYESLDLRSTHNSYKPGAIVFFGDSLTDITHVAILVSPWLVIEAGGGDHKTLTKEDADLANAFVRIRPLRSRKGLVACLFPSVFLESASH
jgi:cell wall-associated NlpC family hydrolase